MTLKHNYWFFKNALPPEQCEDIIKKGEARIAELKNDGFSSSATTFGENYKGAMEDGKPLNDKTIRDVEGKTYVRDSEVCWFNDEDMKQIIYDYVHTANKNAGWNYDWDFGEDIQFTKYGLNQFYGWHFDGSSDHHGVYKRYIPGVTKVKLKKNGDIPTEYVYANRYGSKLNQIGLTRKLSVTINLSKPGDYEGGNLKFDYGHHNKDIKQFYECKEIRPQGSIIVFPSYMWHQVTPVTSGNRYSLVMWCLGRPFR